ncbi:DUF4336 domain-containing protein [Pelagicoccus sp. NFK12]|uniref:DUF4336 domain-containing protein n=1 Tax=Pelagicoccus enzymogenes TaxID=2773457 RepID=A0A927IEA6_9BACT|nr:DUF4336 domain-containing protein [Pelagicoccus enzymogenes]MBD5778827.1 DUF4336 domain-containing protein [Pelagicoccus enzymogenes]
MEKLAENVWFLPFELKALGVNIGRNVTVIRLSSGELLLHSTAPFTSQQVERIRGLGKVRWITDPMVDHDTFSQKGIAAFEEAVFLAPDGFPEQQGVSVQPLLPIPEAWGEEIQVLRLEGADSFSEHVFFHRSSRTLIVCDLLMNFPDPGSSWQRMALRIGLGPKQDPGTSRRLKFAVKDRQRFRASLEKVLQWPFERVVVGHGEPLREDAYQLSKAAWTKAGWLES